MRDQTPLSETLHFLTQRLEPLSETPALDAQVLVAHTLSRPRVWILAHPEAALDDEQQTRLERALFRLETGEALPYVLGEWEFYGLPFTITPNVLIPRPETELLVEKAILWLRSHPGRRFVADVGCGSGCIAVSLAIHIPDLRILATDISQSALAVARSNALRHHVDRQIDFIQADLLAGFHHPFDLICANLPYIPTRKLRMLKVAQREPALALDGGRDGLQAIRRLLEQAPVHLAPGGVLFAEIEASQGEAILALAHSAFPRASVQVFPDLAGRNRLLSIVTSIGDVDQHV